MDTPTSGTPADQNSLSPAVIPALTSKGEDSDNLLLKRFRGHRTRTWGDEEALKLLSLLAAGHSISSAANQSGIPRDAAYYHPALGAAISQVYAREGGDWYEDQLRGVLDGTTSYKATNAIVAGLRVHGRLQERQPGMAGIVVNASQVVLALGEASVEQLRAMALAKEHAPTPTPTPTPVRIREGEAGGGGQASGPAGV